MLADLTRWGVRFLAPALFHAFAAAAPAAVPASSLSLHLTALEAGAAGPGASLAHVQLGTLAATPARGRLSAIARRQRVAVRLDGSTAHARLSVALASEMPGWVVRVDGLRLSTIPRIVDPAHRVGATVVHEVEITIDGAAPAGPFLSNLQWVAESD